MPWQDRIQEAAYTSPNGTRLTFTFEDVSRTVEKKTSAFDFPDADGTLVQDLGHKGRRYPLRVIFSGDDHDIEADNFELILLERGVGSLEHPRYGEVSVVPFGEITQRDDLKTRANQTIIEVVFWATIGTDYPTTDADGSAEALAALDDYENAAAQQLTDGLSVETAVEEVTLRDQWSALVSNVTTALEPLVEAQADAQRAFNDIADSINQSIDVLIGDPLTLAFQTMALIRSPAQLATLVSNRLDAYGSLASDSIAGPSGNPKTIQSTNDSRAPNELASRAMFAQAAVAGSIRSSMNAAQDPQAAGGYDTQPQALAAAEQLLEQLEAVTAWADDNYRALDGTGIAAKPVVDTGDAYQQLQKAAALAAGELVRLAFNLRKERRIVLTRARSIIDFVAEYYGDIDANLDFFINSNELTGSEILELPAGKTVLVYG